MNLSEAFNTFKAHDHSASFDELGPWLDQQPQSPKKMKTIYKIAASLTFLAVILVACTVPVAQEEEIGYMIKGITVESIDSGKMKLAQIPSINKAEVRFTPVIHELLVKDGKALPPEEVTEVVLVLPEANYDAAVTKKQALEAAFSFKSIEILPIEETVERTMFETALNKTFDIKVDKQFTEEEVEIRINTFLHEHSSFDGEVEIKLDREGNRYVEVEIETAKLGAPRIQIHSADGEDEIEITPTESYKVNRDIEQLYQEFTTDGNEVILEEITPEQLLELKKKELEKKKNQNQ